MTTELMNFFPEGFVPDSSGGGGDFIRVPNKDGQSIRVVLLGKAVTGYEYWTTDGKPRRLEAKPQGKPADMREKSDGGFPEKIKQFVAFPAYEYSEDGTDGRVGIFQVNQASIISDLFDIFTSGDYDPASIFIKVERKAGKRVSYSVSGIGFTQKFNKPAPEIYAQAKELDIQTVMFPAEEEGEAQAEPSAVDVAKAATLM
ncbi:ssDNA-binding protein [Plectonema phage Pbo-yong3]|uniref:ssDNA-binding protein n=1 Tax=Plectonema phage Pbo-yong3 TaxID=2970324 RepID=UPI00403D2B7D|nr:ssDNA-binding protein [Plectonema phage Pbo-yong3]